MKNVETVESLKCERGNELVEDSGRVEPQLTTSRKIHKHIIRQRYIPLQYRYRWYCSDPVHLHLVTIMCEALVEQHTPLLVDGESSQSARARPSQLDAIVVPYGSVAVDLKEDVFEGRLVDVGEFAVHKTCMRIPDLV